MNRTSLLAVALALMTSVSAHADIAVEEMAPELRLVFVRNIQQELIARGYLIGTADGAAGPKTRAAILDYQREAGLELTGKASKDLLDHLKFALPRISAPHAPAPYPPPEMVRNIQSELARRGYYSGAVDGKTGPTTRAAVRAFQQDAGVPLTGALDERLLSEVRLAGAAIRSPTR
ncbi:MAG: peptidoglycan-binding protein [Alphaproteobacteria bacterium]|nr:peptidoglycan-binding protein [Alphaproteobacteria bacterium]